MQPPSESAATAFRDAVNGLDRAVRRLRWSLRLSLVAFVLLVIGAAIYAR